MKENNELDNTKASHSSKEVDISVPSQRTSPLLIILIIINTFFVAYLLFQQTKLSELSHQVLQKERATAISQPLENKSDSDLQPRADHMIEQFPIPTITANLLRSTGPQRFIALSIILILETPQKSPLQEMINKASTFRDEIIDLLNSKTPQDLLKLEGREVLKHLLKTHLNESLKQDKVKKILFTQFKVS